jgi:hypothetical protein
VVKYASSVSISLSLVQIMAATPAVVERWYSMQIGVAIHHIRTGIVVNKIRAGYTFKVDLDMKKLDDAKYVAREITHYQDRAIGDSEAELFEQFFSAHPNLSRHDYERYVDWLHIELSGTIPKTADSVKSDVSSVDK